MNIVEDYKKWYDSKLTFLNKFISVDSLITGRLEPIINVLNHLCTKEIDDSEYYIFDIGSLYMYDQVMTLERYSELVSIEKLDDSSVLYNYLMDTIDFYEDAPLEDDVKEELEASIELLEVLLLSQQPLSEDVYNNIEQVKLSITDDYFPVTEIFTEIAYEYEL